MRLLLELVGAKLNFTMQSEKHNHQMPAYYQYLYYQPCMVGERQCLSSHPCTPFTSSIFSHIKIALKILYTKIVCVTTSSWLGNADVISSTAKCDIIGTIPADGLSCVTKIKGWNWLSIEWCVESQIWLLKGYRFDKLNVLHNLA